MRMPQHHAGSRTKRSNQSNCNVALRCGHGTNRVSLATRLPVLGVGSSLDGSQPPGILLVLWQRCCDPSPVPVYAQRNLLWPPSRPPQQYQHGFSRIHHPPSGAVGRSCLVEIVDSPPVLGELSHILFHPLREVLIVIADYLGIVSPGQTPQLALMYVDHLPPNHLFSSPSSYSSLPSRWA